MEKEYIAQIQVQYNRCIHFDIARATQDLNIVCKLQFLTINNLIQNYPLNMEVGARGGVSSWYKLRDGPTNRNTIHPPITMNMEAYANLFSQNSIPFSPTYSSKAFSLRLMESQSLATAAFFWAVLSPPPSSCCFLLRLEPRLNRISTASGGVMVGGADCDELNSLPSSALLLIRVRERAERCWDAQAGSWWEGKVVKVLVKDSMLQQ